MRCLECISLKAFAKLLSKLLNALIKKLFESESSVKARCVKVNVVNVKGWQNG